MKLVSPIFLGAVLASLILPAAAQQPTSTQFNPVPSRIVGQGVLQQQGLLTATAPNLVEGREFSGPQAIALDSSASPPILYVADTGNNRVLAWKNAFGFNNGAPSADKVIGQRDFLSTAQQGPGGDLSTGLTGPIALTVDSKGNLYVVDAGNNRILRYPAPFSQTGDLLSVDLIIGQKDLSGRSSNEGKGAPTEKSLALASGSNLFRSGIAFDQQGNLWVSDAGNNRVLRFPVTALGSQATNEPSADLVLGQIDFTSNALPTTASQSKCTPTTLVGAPCGRSFLSQPSGLAFDPTGRLFVADSLNRVVVFVPPFSINQLIARIMGIDPGTPPQPAPTISATTLGVKGSNQPPEGVFFVGSSPFVVDTGNSRILGYDSFDQWPAESTAFSPPAKKVVGQQSFTASQGNQGLTQPSSSTLSSPVASVFAGTDMIVVDSGNQRVLAFPQQSSGLFIAASRLLGQIDFPYNSVNLIEGREVGFTGNVGSCVVNGVLPFVSGGAAIVDASSTPPHLYIADPTNNRILGFKDYRLANAGSTADLVIGQPDLRTAIVNYPTNSGTQTNDMGLWTPESIAVDSNGNLYVADTCNARVLRFPSPFSQPTGMVQRANLVLGQTSFFGQPIKDLSRQTMRSAYGIAFTANGHLVVSDPLANRVLVFFKPGSGDFQSGAPANHVFGQADFSSGLATVFNSPRGISVDPDDQLYVADTLNNRIAILPNVPTASDNPPVLFSITPLSQPFSVTVNQITDEIWVTNTLGNTVLRYPNYVTVINNPATNATLSPISAPLAVSLDPFGNPIVTEGINRVSFYFPAIDFTTSAGGVTGRLSGNGANYFGRWSPGMLASLFSFTNTRFGDQTVINSTLPVPATLGDIQVFVAGTAAPLLYVSPTQINLQIPSNTPVGGFQEFKVVRASTGQVLASWLFRIDSVSPGLFTANATGSGQLLATNADGTVNNASHPAKAGTYVTLYGTGQGLVSGMPPDGVPTPGAILSTNAKPNVLINGPNFVPDSDVQFSGLCPGFVGLWQINVKVPANVPPGDVPVFVSIGGISSSLDPNGIRRTTTIRTTP